MREREGGRWREGEERRGREEEREREMTPREPLNGARRGDGDRDGPAWPQLE